MLRQVIKNQRNLWGAMLKDSRRYHVALSASDQSYLALCNRHEKLDPAPDGRGYKCNWLWTSDLHAPKHLPTLGKRLMHRALGEHPIRRAAQPEAYSGTAKISFLIGHRGRGRLPHLMSTLESIAAQRDIPVECIVVEQDEEPIIAAHLPKWVRYVHSKPPRLNMPYCRSWAFNIGAKHCNTDVMVLHDNDMLIPSDYASSIIGHVREGYELVNLKRFIFYLSQEHTTVLSSNSDHYSFAAPMVIVQNLEAGGSVAITRAAYDRIGGMDESFIGWGGEDNEFWERAQTLKVWPYAYLPIVHLWHAAQPGKNMNDNINSSRYAELSTVPVLERIRQLKEVESGRAVGPVGYPRSQ